MYYNSPVELSILIAGKPAKTYGHNGLAYIEGRVGTEFTLKIKNNTNGRILACPSIDRLSVMDGEAATSNSAGYIIDAYSSYEVRGWRTSLNDVSKFVFSKRGNSLSNQTGNGFSNCGVIGCIAFSEKQMSMRITYYPYNQPNYTLLNIGDNYTKGMPKYTQTFDTNHTLTLNDNSNTSNVPLNMPVSTTFSSTIDYCEQEQAPSKTRSAPSPINRKLYKSATLQSQKETPKFKLGTDYGDNVRDNVTESTFQKDNLIQSFEIHYTTRHELETIGIDVEKKNNKVSIPSAFSDRKFCKLPPRK